MENILFIRLTTPEAKAFMGDHYHEGHVVTASWEVGADIRLTQECYTMAQLKAKLPAGWQPDLILVAWPEWNAVPLDIFLEEIPVVALVSDWSIAYADLIQYLPDYDHVFMDKKGARLFGLQGLANVSYEPLYSYNPKIHYITGETNRDIDISIVAGFNHELHHERSHWLKRLCDLRRLGINAKIFNGVYDEGYTEILNRSKIVFNHAIRSEMNLRSYEAPAGGALLMQEEKNEEINEHLQPFMEYVPYRKDNFVELVQHYLSHEEERQAIALRGQRKIIAKDNYTKHFEQIMKSLQTKGVLTGYRKKSIDPNNQAFLRRQMIHYYSTGLGPAALLLRDILNRAESVVSIEEDPWWLNARACVAELTIMENSLSMGKQERGSILKQAFQDLTEAIELNKSWFVPLFNRYRLNLFTGNYKLALAEFDMVYQRCLKTKLDGFYGLLIYTKYDDFRFERETIYFSAASESIAHGQLTSLFLSELFEGKGKASLALGQKEEAIVALESSVAHRANNSEARYLLASMLFKQGETASAAKHLQVLLQHTPFHFSAVMQLYGAYLMLGQREEAGRLAEEYLAVVDAIPYYEEWRERLLPLRMGALPNPK